MTAPADIDYHQGIICDGCRRSHSNFTGTRYHCTECPDYDLCDTCFGRSVETNGHRRTHNTRAMTPAETRTQREQIRAARAAQGIDGADILDALRLAIASAAEQSSKQAATKQSVIDALPVEKMRPGLISDPEKASCAICQVDFVSGESVTHLPCGHYFHHKGEVEAAEEEDCAGIVSWLKNSHECPLCRHKLEADVPPVSCLDMSAEWKCPGCDEVHPGDMLRGRNAQCSCGVTRNVVLLLSRSDHFTSTLNQCVTFCRRVFDAIREGSNSLSSSVQTSLMERLEELVQQSSVVTLQEQHWEVQLHIRALFTAMIEGETHFPILLTCPNSRAVLRHIHIRLSQLRSPGFQFHTRSTGPVTGEDTTVDLPRRYPLLPNVQGFIKQNTYMFDEVAKLLTSNPSQRLCTLVGSVLLPKLTAGNWKLEEAYRLLSAGERDLSQLTRGLGLDLGSSAVIEHMWIRVMQTEGRAIETSHSTNGAGVPAELQSLYQMLSAIEGDSGVSDPELSQLISAMREIGEGCGTSPWECPGCDAEVTGEACTCGVERKVLLRFRGSDVTTVTERLQGLYISALAFRMDNHANRNTRLLIEREMEEFKGCTEARKLEDGGWRITGHFLSLLQCVLSGGSQYPIFGLDNNSRGLIRLIHRELANVHLPLASFFEIDLAPTNRFTLPDSFIRPSFEALARETKSLVDEISGCIVYSSVEMRWAPLHERRLPHLEACGWKLTEPIRKMVSGVRDVQEITGGVDANSAGMATLILACVIRREGGDMSVLQHTTASTTTSGQSDDGNTTSRPRSSQSWGARLFSNLFT
mmetsp:Transcript_18049/g.26554  ORF Transcript_18049/g.26554 Transcript_18049/m.26554 type:complete len:810 (+) Transcript_18049:106-2535(+)